MRYVICILAVLVSLPASAQLFLREDTASQAVVLGPFVDTDGAAVTGLTIDAADVRLSVNGANIGAKNSGGCTHDELGGYTCTFDATDTATAGRLQALVAETGALIVKQNFMVLPTTVYDSLVLGTDTLPADVIQWLGTAAATPGTAGVPSVDMIRVSTDSAAADRLEAILDGTCGSYPELGVLRGNGCTAQAYTAGTPSLTLDSSAAFGDNALANAVVMICGSTQGYCQSATIISNVLSTDVATLDAALEIEATGTITYTIYGTPQTSAAATPPSAASIRAEIDSNSTQLAAIVADTNEVQTDLTNGGRLDLLIDLILADTGELQTDWVNGGRLDLLIDAILADSAELQTDWANGGRLDLLLDAVLADTGELQTDWANGGRLDLLIDALIAARTQLFQGTADSGDTDTMVDGALTAEFATDDLLIGRYVVREDAQACLVSDYVAATGTVEFGACAFTGDWTTQTYDLYPAGTQ